jgi:hypothetical protein
MLFQASEEKRDPTCATHSATTSPNSPEAAVTTATKPKSGTIGAAP